jgi:hypothetical protein
VPPDSGDRLEMIRRSNFGTFRALNIQVGRQRDRADLKEPIYADITEEEAGQILVASSELTMP